MKSARFSLVLLGLALTVTTATAQVSTQSPHGPLPDAIVCTDCHTKTAWTPVRSDLNFSHDRDTEFRLVGAHEQTSCASCHLDLEFGKPELKEDDCASCHVDVHQGNFVQSCATCHNSWSFVDVDGIQVHQTTTFPLTGTHIQISCESCHVDEANGAFSTLDTECSSCHADASLNSQTFDHVAQGLTENCEQCHGTTSWIDATFDHLLLSDGFELVGAHGSLACASCHSVPGYGMIFDPSDQSDCVACHQADYTASHVVEGFETGTICADCHSADTWSGAEFEHVSVSNGFDLVGAHAPLACESCHAVPGFSLLFQSSDQNDCVACHESDYTTSHVTEGFETGTICADCHGTDTWSGAEFEHVSVSNGFDLLGAHAPLACESCHVVPGFDPLFQTSDDSDCVACHQSDYETSHVAEGFETGTICADCHSADTWSGAEFDHVSVSSGFDLLGAHAPLACESCHVVPGFDPLFQTSDDGDCVACHQSDYETSHVVPGYETGTVCSDCHGNAAWLPATFDHATTANGFDLVGAHAPLACESCHVVPGFALLFQASGDNDCVACHQSDYETSHVAQGYETGTVCGDCHSSAAWLPATFDHVVASNGFDLLGAHAPLACESCHMVPGYDLLFQSADQNDCVACHDSDYQASHVAASLDLGTFCSNCHAVDTWEGAVFDHDAQYFPISSGPHAGGADDCQACHNVPNDFVTFTCFSCHQHDQPRMDDKHSEERDYTYESSACLSCHPDGRH